MANKIYYSKTVLTGGTADALDYIDGNLLTDGDFAYVFVSGIMYFYKLNATSGLSESSPDRIAPDTNAGTKIWELQKTYSVPLPRSYLAGLALSNATDTEHDITIAAGICRDSTNAYDLLLSSAMTKRIDAAWAAGTGNGGLFTGSVGSSTWYHVFLIRKTSDGSIDAGFDTSITAANIPSGYVAYRRIGSVLTNGSANILNFYQVGDDFLFLSPILDIDATNPGTSAVTAAISTPLGVVTKALLGATIEDAVGDNILYISSLSVTDNAATSTNISTAAKVTGTGTQVGGQVVVHTNTSSQIRYRVSFSAAGTKIKIATLGYTDRRGRDD